MNSATPADNIGNKGERLVPGLSSPRLVDEHLARNEFAGALAVGKDVLDIACGTGYGSHRLAEVARKVVGADVSVEAVDYARRNFSRDNLEYRIIDAGRDDLGEAAYDIIVSFETIEHLETGARAAFLANVVRALRPDGMFLLSTPNKRVTSPFTAKPLNRFHVIEFTRPDLSAELSGFFGDCEWRGQRFVPTFLLWKPVRLAIRLVEKVLRRDFGLYTTVFDYRVRPWSSRLVEPRLQVVSCRKR